MKESEFLYGSSNETWKTLCIFQRPAEEEEESGRRGGRTVGGGGNVGDEAWMCMRSVEGVGDAVKLGMGILDEDLLDDPPEGRTVGDVVMHSSRHS